MTTRVLVDFNTRDDDGNVPAPLGDVAGGTPAPGERIDLFDEAENTCRGVVIAVKDAFITVQPIWDTFSHGGEAAEGSIGKPPTKDKAAG